MRTILFGLQPSTLLRRAFQFQNLSTVSGLVSIRHFHFAAGKRVLVSHDGTKSMRFQKSVIINPSLFGIGSCRFASHRILEPGGGDPGPLVTVSSIVSGSKKRVKRKGLNIADLVETETAADKELHQATYPIVAYATSDELSLEALRNGVLAQGLYKPSVWANDPHLQDVVHVTANYPTGDEPREIFFFREGTVVFWNVPDLERGNVLKFMKSFEVHSYEKSEVMHESEFMFYRHNEANNSRLSQGKILLSKGSGSLLLEKYTIANSLALSVKLGIWESALDRFVDGIDHITQDLKAGKPLKLTRSDVLKKIGEIFDLRNELNLNSDLLDTPDFYWEHENLERLYLNMCNYLSIRRRTDVMNEKLVQCCELLELISGHLNDNHHVRLEWMIIILIMLEVGFEIFHIAERYWL